MLKFKSTQAKNLPTDVVLLVGLLRRDVVSVEMFRSRDGLETY